MLYVPRINVYIIEAFYDALRLEKRRRFSKLVALKTQSYSFCREAGTRVDSNEDLEPCIKYQEPDQWLCQWHVRKEDDVYFYRDPYSR